MTLQALRSCFEFIQDTCEGQEVGSLDVSLILRSSGSLMGNLIPASLEQPRQRRCYFGPFPYVLQRLGVSGSLPGISISIESGLWMQIAVADGVKPGKQAQYSKATRRAYNEKYGPQADRLSKVMAAAGGKQKDALQQKSTSVD